MEALFDASLLMFALLNPLLMSAYLIEVIRDSSFAQLSTILLRAALISSAIFLGFAAGGETVFSQMLHVRFEAFMIFGGIVFLVTGLRMMLTGEAALTGLRGSPGRVAGAIAMPFMTGPGTVSAAVLIGNSLPFVSAAVAILAAVAVSIGSLLVFKVLHDYANRRNEALIERYVEIAGRVTALFVGTFAVEMILTGLERVFGS